MFAQSVVEYGALASAKSNFQIVGGVVRDFVGQFGPGTWIAVGALVVLAWWFRRR